MVVLKSSRETRMDSKIVINLQLINKGSKEDREASDKEPNLLELRTTAKAAAKGVEQLQKLLPMEYNLNKNQV